MSTYISSGFSLLGDISVDKVGRSGGILSRGVTLYPPCAFPSPDILKGGKFSKGGSISPSSIGFSIAEAPCGVLLVSSVDRFCCCRKISSLTLFKVSDNLLWSLIGIQGLFFSSELPRSGVGESGLGNGRFSYIPESDSEGFGTN